MKKAQSPGTENLVCLGVQNREKNESDILK